jgi:ubiquitin C-terminal hydrolase
MNVTLQTMLWVAPELLSFLPRLLRCTNVVARGFGDILTLAGSASANSAHTFPTAGLVGFKQRIDGATPRYQGKYQHDVTEFLEFVVDALAVGVKEIEPLFFGGYCSTITCPAPATCGTRLTPSSPFSLLALEISDGAVRRGRTTVSACLENFLDKETLSPANSCINCQVRKHARARGGEVLCA